MTLPAARLAPVILAGGTGIRLWPVSRAAFPKHLVELFGEESLLQSTARRVLHAAPASRVVTVTAAGQAVLVRRQLESIDPALLAHVLAEPSPRNTAAATALAALHARAALGDDSILWVCPSDHVMFYPDALRAALEAGLPAADAGWLVTFGITPTRPETGFGWIASADPVPHIPGVRQVASFVEKPPREAAAAMLAEGGYAWNSGMFLMRASSVLDELARHEPGLLASAEAAFATLRGGTIDPALYAAIMSASIDKAVMERSSRVAVVPCDPGWSDVGSWHMLWELMDKDAEANAVQGDAVLVGSRNNLVRSEKRLVALAGVQGLAVIETADAVLVADRQVGEAIRGVVDALAYASRKEASVHLQETRPSRDTLLREDVGLEDNLGRTTLSERRRYETWKSKSSAQEYNYLNDLVNLLNDIKHLLDEDQDMISNMLRAQVIGTIEIFIREVENPISDRIVIQRKAQIIKNTADHLASRHNKTDDQIFFVEKLMKAADKILDIIVKWAGPFL